MILAALARFTSRQRPVLLIANGAKTKNLRLRFRLVNFVSLPADESLFRLPPAGSASAWFF
jgi:hypothetical protein